MLCGAPPILRADILQKSAESALTREMRVAFTERTVRDWLGRIDKDAKESRDQRIFDMWMACHTLDEIAETESASTSDVDRVVKNFSQNGEIANLGKPEQAAATHSTDFETPIYNIWKQVKATRISRVSALFEH